MTREEAIIILKDCELNPCVRKDKEAANMAIKALEQEDILDKIRAEIEALPNADPSYPHTCDVVDREDVFDIIDEYKAESEDKI